MFQLIGFLVLIYFLFMLISSAPSWIGYLFGIGVCVGLMQIFS